MGGGAPVQMKDLLVECHGCKATIFNDAVFIFAGKFAEAFCSGRCLLTYLQKNETELKEPTAKKREPLKVEHVRSKVIEKEMKKKNSIPILPPAVKG